ncbi:MAG TPA: endolytic transglycosylase MltG [Rhizomicrobium sp.]|nr:endolytic transglycosylase MltG [Rhizomicrobium sp.]
MRFFLFLLLAAAIAVGAFLWERQNFEAAGPAPRPVVVLVVPGEHLAEISQKLADAGAIRNPIFFRFGVRLRGQSGALKAGEYAIPAQASMADIMAILVSGKSIEHKLTAAEGLTSQMIYDIVKSDPVLTGEAGAVPAEGTLLPETYLFTRGVTRAEMLGRMADAQKQLLARLWPARAPDLPVKTQDEAIVLASIVEKETSIAEERRHIAAVFENRLRLGMRLQSDPTIIYGLTKGYPLGRGIRESELAGATPYNTYVISGLPPTPICNPGKDAIAAVLDPENSKDLYFVADGTGGHVFSATIAGHEKNVSRWRRIEKASESPPPPKTALPHKAHQG